MENSTNMFGKSKSTRSPTRLQRRAPTALHLDPVPDNPFLQQSCDSIAGSAIPLLSPLYVSPNSHSSEGIVIPNQETSPSTEGQDFTFPVSITEKNTSEPLMDNKDVWQYSSAKTDHNDQICLLDMFQTKFVLVDNSQ